MNALSRWQNKLYSCLHNPCVLLRKPQVQLKIFSFLVFLEGQQQKNCYHRPLSQKFPQISVLPTACKPALWFLHTCICCSEVYNHLFQVFLIGFFLLFPFMGRRRSGYREEFLGSCQDSISLSCLQKMKLKIVIYCTLVIAPNRHL